MPSERIRCPNQKPKRYGWITAPLSFHRSNFPNTKHASFIKCVWISRCHHVHFDLKNYVYMEMFQNSSFPNPWKSPQTLKKIVNHTLDASKILHPLIWRIWESPIICKIFSTIPSVKRSTLNRIFSWSWLCTSTLSPPKVSWGQGRAPNQWKPQTMGCVPSKWPYLFFGKTKMTMMQKTLCFFLGTCRIQSWNERYKY